MKKAVLMILSLITLMITGCESEERPMEITEERFNEIVEELRFADTMEFDNKFANSILWIERFHFFNRDLHFVHTEAEAMEFDHQREIAGWPSLWTQGMVEGFNLIEDIGFATHGLSNPLTVTDMVDNWQAVWALWNELTEEQQGFIRRHARDNYGEEFWDNSDLRRWLFPGVLDEFNALIEGRNINRIDLTRLNERPSRADRQVTVDNLPTWPITEEDVHNDPELISFINSSLLTVPEQNSTLPIVMFFGE